MSAPLERTRVLCHASNRDPAKPATTCGAFLGYVRGPVVFAGLSARAPETPDGSDYVRCWRCKTWNRFDVITQEAS